MNSGMSNAVLRLQEDEDIDDDDLDDEDDLEDEEDDNHDDDEPETWQVVHPR